MLNPCSKVSKKTTQLCYRLKPIENCVDVPKEVCVRVRNNPRQIKRPVIKKWCYTPTEESGLGDHSARGAEISPRNNDEDELNTDEQSGETSTVPPNTTNF